MRRTKQALPSATSQFPSRNPGMGANLWPQRVPAQPVALYGAMSWQVCPATKPGRALGTEFSLPTRLQPVQSVSQSANKPNPRRRQRRRRYRSGLRTAGSSDRIAKTDFTFLIGAANALAIEALLFVALWLAWYGISDLSAAVSL